jgi:hypothetical protein
MHLSLINIAVFEVVLSRPMFFSVTCLSFINTVIIFNRLFQEFQRISNSFLAKNFFGQIFQFPQNDFKSPLGDNFGGDVGKFSIGQENIQLLNSEDSILTILKFLQRFNALIDIFTPVKDISDDLVGRLDIIGCKVNLSQRLNIILPFLNQ